MLAPAAPRVLVTDAHTTSALAVVRSLGRRGMRVTVAGEHGRCNMASVSRHAVRSVVLAHAETEPLAYVEQLAAELRAGYDLLVPTTDTTLTILRQHREAFERLVRLALPPNPALDAALDKLQTIHAAAAHGVAVPRTCPLDRASDLAAAAPRLSYPCVVKPRFARRWNGAGPLTRGTVRYAVDQESLRRLLERAPEELACLAQEFVPGAGVGVFVLADRGRPRALFAHRRLREADPTGARASLAESIALEPRLVDPALRLIAALGWHGVAMVEFKDRGKPYAPVLMEINGRFWGSLPLAVAAGVDFPAMLADLMLDRPFSPPAGYRVGLRCRHLPGDLSFLAAVLKGRPPHWHGAFPTPLSALAAIAPWPGRWAPYNFRLKDPAPALSEALAFVRRELRSLVSRPRHAGAAVLPHPR